MILVDTTVLVDVERGREGVQEALRRINQGDIVAMSAISLHELHVGIGYTRQKLGPEASSKKADNVRKICDDYHVIDVSREILTRSGEREGELLARGILVDIEDIIIGITAETKNVEVLITRNPDHFGWCGVNLLAYTM